MCELNLGPRSMGDCTVALLGEIWESMERQSRILNFWTSTRVQYWKNSHTIKMTTTVIGGQKASFNSLNPVIASSFEILNFSVDKR